MTNKDLANLIFPNITKTIEDYEKMYPKRDLPDDAIVTRAAPSPTGYTHMGTLFQAFISKKAAKDTNGVFYIRIEDTDRERLVSDAVDVITTDLKYFNIIPDEGVISNGKEIGKYGPYTQSDRKEIYQAFTLRLKSPGDFNKKVIVNDLIKGKISFPENDMDIVIMKQDGLPTYHFAHLVDDHLMRTTHVIRGDEWLSSLPTHIQLFEVFGFDAPKYAHISPILKEDNGVKRKLSKRKDPEAQMSYYREKGIPVKAVELYLMTLANTNFEQWWDANKDKSIDDFKYDFKKTSKSGGLFDVEKLHNISKNYLARIKATEFYDMLISYTKEYDKEFYEIITKNKEFTIGLLNIERNQKKPRKDYASFSEVKDLVWYMFDELFDNHEKDYEFTNINDRDEILTIMNTYINKYYNESDDQETWFNKIKDLSESLGYAREVKEYKENPDNYKGHVGDVSMVIRVALTTRKMTPNLYDIIKLFGKDKIVKRIKELEKNI